MLPPFVVKKLKAKHDTVIVDHFDSVTVMFCEIVNFNALLEKMPAQEVVQLLNDVYLIFLHYTKQDCCLTLVDIQHLIGSLIHMVLTKLSVSMFISFI